MKQKLACALLTAALFLVASPLRNATAQQSPKDAPGASTTNSDAAKTKAGAPAASASPRSADDHVQVPLKPDDKVILNTGIVNVVISVTDPYGRFVTGLGKDHFDVFDDKVKQQIAHFSDDDAPVSLGIVYDVSGSMKERIHRSIRALKRFIETSHDDDDFFLIGFNDRAKLVQDFTTSGDQVVSHLMFVQPKGSTALYDAAYIAVEKVAQGRHTKKALLIISDGQDNNSR